MHKLSSLQAVAHGAEAVQYFQWRKSRGSVEKFHGAVIDHVGHLDTRIGREVSELGRMLAAMAPVQGSRVDAKVAIVFDWESRWAMDNAQGPRNTGLHYERTVAEHYRTFWEQGVAVDVINADVDLSGYALVIAPMLYMVRDGFAARVEQHLRQGGQFVASYWTGVVNESDLCHLGGFPGPLRPLLGIWAEEIDSLTDDETNGVCAVEGNMLGLRGSYQARELCEHIHLEGATALAVYQSDFYAGQPAVTVNAVGAGQAWYIASRNDQAFHRDFYGALIARLALPRALAVDLPPGVTAHRRTDGESSFIFLQNFTAQAQTVTLPAGISDLIDGVPLSGEQIMPPWGCRVLRAPL